MFGALHHNKLWQPLDRYLRKYPDSACKTKQELAGSSPLHSFLRSNEWQHLHLSSVFVAQLHEEAKKQALFAAGLDCRRAFIYSRNAAVFDRDLSDGDSETPSVQALLLWTKRGRLLFDCCSLRGFDRSSGEVLPYLAKQELRHLLPCYPPRQFIGTRSHYDFLQQLYDFHFEMREYWIMVRYPQAASTALPQPKEHLASMPAELRLQRLVPAHYRDLLPLEKAYYAEEVLLGSISPAVLRALEKQCAKRLEGYLQYGLFAGKDLVARAMINTYGLHYWQIGGIYTVPKWRSCGLANYLLGKLCYSIEHSGRSAMLFVRQENQVAQNLYHKNGFESLDCMVIAQEFIS